MVRSCPEAARVRVDPSDTILHLCVKHNQWKSLEKLLDIVQGQDFVNAKDNDGNSILHLAILYKRSTIASHVLEKKTIDVNATNASGHTAMDLLFLEPNQKDVDPFESILGQANAERAKDLVGGDWLTKKRDSLMIVASFIATMAFQAAVNPPGGVW
ncbi:hypothetical protein RHMOL_Rhmol13G0221800 [Rhododendron molle]|uniref:Uncharacterized protein n=1 Tax=Rhododendron molle TaxID=49168 RepID=A0ACC0LAG2_RHOML|nr:hypothetical protein RHMOL_Rhmol13G0221800 [Rhododendron molle]